MPLPFLRHSQWSSHLINLKNGGHEGFQYLCFLKYVHIGSLNEYNELKYWENYFKNEN